MIKASALYLVIVIALVVAVLCSALIVSAYYYRLSYQQKFRADCLATNLESGINYVLTGNDAFEEKVQLFPTGDDSVTVSARPWGIYHVGTCEAFIQHDTISKAFMIGRSIDSAKWAALYLIDEDRPLSFSGKTNVTGDVYVPKAGIRSAYVDNKAYEGNSNFVTGHQFTSMRSLPTMSSPILGGIQSKFEANNQKPRTLNRDSITNSFLHPGQTIYFGKKPLDLSGMTISGNIIIRSDTTVTIGADTHLKNVQIYGRAIIAKDGFKGNCQLFATDSVSIGSNCSLEYPSAIGVLQKAIGQVTTQALVYIGPHSRIYGVIFSYQGKDTKVPSVIKLGKASQVHGQVYASGNLLLQDDCKIYGSAFTNRFLYQSRYSTYENYLINATINSSKLPSYYLTSILTPIAGSDKKVLAWLEN